MEVLEKNQIITNQIFKDKQELFEAVGQIALENGVVDNIENFIEGLYEREREMSTCFEDGIAIPHCRNNCVRRAAIFIVKTAKDIDWDGEHNKVNFIILLSVPKDENNTHINILSTVARKLVNDSFKEKILSLTDAEQIYNNFNELVKE